MPEFYSRKVSGEEAEEGHLMVLKDRLSFFPAEGERFSVQIGGVTHETAVESYHCECRGPDKPHEHWFIRLPGLVKGERVTLSRAAGGFRLER